MNRMTAIAVYAAICAELDVPFAFPGKPGAWTALYEATDAPILAAAAQWVATSPACAGEAFNITNGDVFRWCNLWPQLAASFDVPTAEPRYQSLARFVADKAPVWDRIVVKHDLRPYAFEDVVSWASLMRSSAPSGTSPARRSKPAGTASTPWIETDRMFTELLDDLQRNHIIPTPTGAPR
jgi:hypothetical protein